VSQPQPKLAQRAVLAALDDATLAAALRRMHLIRKFEETAEQSYMRGLVHGTMHLSIGQEASAVGAILHLRPDDYILSTHRGHGHCIAKGADVARMLAEFFGKETGYCRGRGGSMHIADLETGNLGANGIVAGGLPIAVGVGMSIRMQKQSRVCMVFFGDGATNEGAFHEALNLASIWTLPIVFLCENNKYGMSMDIAKAMAVPHVADRAASYAMPGVAVDGQRSAGGRGGDPRGHRSRARRPRTLAGRMQDLSPSWALQERPQPVSHEGGDRGLARPRPDRAARERAPPARPARPSHDRVRRDEAQMEIEAALEFAKSSPMPDPSDLTRDVYAA
jgi:pyruvate dehydrogenase E1 component alpha subunit